MFIYFQNNPKALDSSSKTDFKLDILGKGKPLFPFQNNLKNLDPYKMDLDFCDCFEKKQKNFHFISILQAWKSPSTISQSHHLLLGGEKLLVLVKVCRIESENKNSAKGYVVPKQIPTVGLTLGWSQMLKD